MRDRILQHAVHHHKKPATSNLVGYNLPRIAAHDRFRRSISFLQQSLARPTSNATGSLQCTLADGLAPRLKCMSGRTASMVLTSVVLCSEQATSHFGSTKRPSTCVQSSRRSDSVCGGGGVAGAFLSEACSIICDTRPEVDTGRKELRQLSMLPSTV